MTWPQLVDHAMDFTKAVGLPGVVLLAGLAVIWDIGDRYLDHIIEIEGIERVQRYKMQEAQAALAGEQHVMMSTTMSQLIRAHDLQAQSVQDIAQSIRAQANRIK